MITGNTQILGRGTRLYEGKKDCLVLDYTLKGIEVVNAGKLTGHYLTEAGEEVEDTSELETIEDGEYLADLDKIAGKINRGDGILVTPGQLFRQSKDAWFADKDLDVFSMQASFSYPNGGEKHRDLVFAVTLPNYRLANRIKEGLNRGKEALSKHPDNLAIKQAYDQLMDAWKVFHNYCLWEVEKDGLRWVCSDKPLYYGEDHDILLDNAIEYISDNTEPLCSKKSKSWRSQPASEKQVNLCNSLWGVTPVSKGHASKIISHGMIKPRVLARLEQIRKECKQYGELE